MFILVEVLIYKRILTALREKIYFSYLMKMPYSKKKNSRISNLHDARAAKRVKLSSIEREDGAGAPFYIDIMPEEERELKLNCHQTFGCYSQN